MDLQEKLTALEAQNKQYLNIIDNLNAEKIALDQMYVESLKSALIAKKELILSNSYLKNEQTKSENLQKEKEKLSLEIIEKQKKIDEFQSTIHLMASEAQAIEG